MSGGGLDTMPAGAGEAKRICLVGLGNPDRRDDGLGAFVLAGMESLGPARPVLRLLTRRHLELDLVEDLRGADLIVLIDAHAGELPGGLKWTKAEPTTTRLPAFTHTAGPDQLVGLLDFLYNKRPAAWVLSIQGDDFSFGQGLSEAAGQRAARAVEELTRFLAKEGRS